MTATTQTIPGCPPLTCSAELCFLIDCARSLHSPTAWQQRGTTEIDHRVLFQEADRHGVTPLLVRSDGLSLVPEIAERTFEESRRFLLHKGLRQASALLELLDLLEGAGLRPLPYKGPSLAVQTLGDPGLRDAVDLDILVPPEDAPAALTLLERVGFKRSRTYPRSAMRQLFAYRAEIGLERDDLLVELQWRLAPRYFSEYFDIVGAWGRRRAIPFGGRTIKVMSPEDTLLALSIHGTKHQWEKLKWLIDVDLLARREDVDWSLLISRARASGVLRILLTTLLVTRCVLGTPLPSEVSEALRQDPLSSLRAKRLPDFCVVHPVQGETEHHRLMLALRERWLDKVRYIARLAHQPTESEWDAVALPHGLQWLYYVLRVGRVAGKTFS